MPSKKLTRRDFLRTTAISAGAVALNSAIPKALASSAPTGTTARSRQSANPATVVMHFDRSDFSTDLQAQFEAQHPNIKLQFIPEDNTRLLAMFAAGNPPDIMRMNCVILPGYLVRKLAMDLQPYIAASTVFKPDDFAPCNDLLRYDGQTTGKGDLYAIAKDWSPEFSLFVNTQIFQDAGVPVPDDSAPITYTQIMDMAQKLTKRSGDRTLNWGFGSQFMSYAWVQTVMECLAQAGQSLYSPDMKKMILKDNPEAVKVVKYMYDLAKADLMPNPLDPSPTWEGDEFTKGRLGIAQFGFWYSAGAESDATRGKVKFLPAPLWAGTTRRDPCAAATCSVMSSQTKVADAAWEVIEWYSGKDAAIARAKSGWGVPALKSLYPLMPSETPFQKQVQNVLTQEIKAANYTLQFNPYYDANNANTSVWKSSLEKALRGSISFDDMIASIEDANNQAIQDGVDQIG